VRQILVIGVSVLLLGQMTLVVAGLFNQAQAQDVPTVVDSDYGVSSALQELNTEMDNRKASPAPAIQENLSHLRSIYTDRAQEPTYFADLEAEMALKDETDLVTAPLDLAGEIEAYDVPLNHQGYEVKQVDPPPSIRADIFDWILTNPDVGNVTLFETILSLLGETYFIYTKYHGYQNVTSVDLITTLAGASTGAIREFAESMDESLLKTLVLTIAEAIDNLGEQSGFGWESIDVTDDGEADLSVRLVPFMRNISGINATGPGPIPSGIAMMGHMGVAIEMKETEDTELPDPIEVGILRAIGYPGDQGEDQSYIWTVDHVFSELPDEYQWEVYAEDVSLELSMDSLTGLVNMTTFDPPYTIRYHCDNNIDLPSETNIESLSMLPGYGKFVWEQGMEPEEALTDITFVNVTFTRPLDPVVNIPEEVVIRIKGDDVGQNQYDAIEWYASGPQANLLDDRYRTNVDLAYYEIKENPAEALPFHSYILAQVEGLPYGDLGHPGHDRTSLFLEINNASASEDDPWTVAELQATGNYAIRSVRYWDYEYFSENEFVPATYENHSYHKYLYLEVHDIPAKLYLEGSFHLLGNNDPITDFDEVTNTVGDFINEVILRIASKLYAIGLTLRGIPEAVLGVSASGGRFNIRLRNMWDNPDHLGSAFLYYTSDRYLEYPGDDDFFAIYNQTAYLSQYASDNRSVQSDNNTMLAVSARLSGIGDITYQSEGEIYRNISLNTAGYRDKPFRFFFQNTDVEHEPTNWANITISDLPQRIELNFTGDRFIYTATSNHDDEVIENITFRSYSAPTYTSFDLVHLPASLQLRRTSDILYLEAFGDQGEDYFDFAFSISNFSSEDNVTLHRWGPHYNGSYALLHQQNTTLPNERSSVSGRLLGISLIRLVTGEEQSEFRWRLRDSVPFRVGVYDPTDYQDPTLGLNAYVELAALPKSILVTIPPVNATSLPATQVGNISSLADIARLVTQIASMGNTLVDLVSDLSLNLVSGVGGLEAGAEFQYELTEPLDMVGWVHKGDTTLLGEPRWIHGLWAREEEVDEGTILAARILLRGLPPKIDLDFAMEGDNIEVNLQFFDLTPLADEGLDYLLVDVKGIRGVNAALYLPQLPEGLDLEANVDLVVNTTAENLTLQGGLGFNTFNHQLGTVYVSIEESESASYKVRTIFSDLPGEIDLAMDVTDNMSLTYDGHGDEVEYVLAELEVGDTSELTSYWVHGLSAEIDEDNEAASAKVYLEGLPSYAHMELDRGDEGTRLRVEAEDFHDVEPTAPDYIILDLRNVSNLDILLFLDQLPADLDGNPEPLDLEVDLWLRAATEGARDLQGQLNITLSEPLASAYVRVVERSNTPVMLEAAVPNVPETLSLSVGISDTVALDFASSEPLDWALVAIDLGDTTDLEAYWTHGLVIRQGKAAGHEPIAVRLFLTGLPTAAHLDTDFSKNTLIHLSLEEFTPTTYQWAIVDVFGFGNVSFILYVSHIPEDTDLNATFDIDADETYWVKDHFDIQNSRQLGASYLKTYNHSRPGTTEVYLSHVPRNLKADLFSGKRVDLTVSGDDPGYIIWINLAKKTYGQWRNIHATVHDTPERFRFVIEPSYRFDMHKPVVFQGFPSIRVETTSDDIDVYLHIDPGYTGSFTGTRLHAINAGDNTKLETRYRDGVPIFVIDAPNRLGQAFYRVDGAPSTKQFYLDYLEIHARDVRYVVIEAKMLFGTYPIFVLENAQGGELLFGVAGELTLLGLELEVHAVLLDIRLREVGGQPVVPSWSSAQVNGATTELGSGTRHYIIPEPVSSLLGCLGGTFLG